MFSLYLYFWIIRKESDSKGKYFIFIFLQILIDFHKCHHLFYPSYSLCTILVALATADKSLIFSVPHFSKESQDDVRRTIDATHPDLVMVELCSARISILSMNEETLLKEASSLNYEKIAATIKQVRKMGKYENSWIKLELLKK